MVFENYKLASNANSPTYFSASSGCSSISNSIIMDLMNLSRLENKVVRLCLHGSPDDILHNMVIAHPKGIYVRPHANPNKPKTYQIIDGSMIVIGLDRNRKIIFDFEFSREQTQLFRVEKNIYLFLWPITDVCVFHEIALGPFMRNSDTVFAPWSPEFKDDSFIDELFGMRKVKGVV